MSPDDVDGSEMDGRSDTDDAATEALISGLGGDVDPALADLLGDVRTAYRSQAPVMGEALASFIAGASSPSPADRRTSRMRSHLTAKVATIVAALVAGTGGLAVAGALPGPIQSVAKQSAAHVGLNLPDSASPRAVEVTSNNPASGVFASHHSHPHGHAFGHAKHGSSDTVEPTEPPETCTPESPEPPETTAPAAATDGTEHETEHCPPATPPGNHHGDHHGDQHESGDQNGSGDQNRSGDTGGSGSGDNHSGDDHSTTTTTVSGDHHSGDGDGTTTTTTEPDHSGDGGGETTTTTSGD